jgi:hypothetical protein
MEREDLTARVMKDMDPELLDFLTMYVDSFIKWELLRFFYENPSTIDTGENIARYAGRPVNDVQNDLTELTRDGILQAIPMGPMPVYTLNPDSNLHVRLEKFIEATKDREFRRKAIYHLVRR